ncbi:phosphotriesterase family protein [Meridianimarinicoccus sp. RP-17]|uniref:phosphotriesterase family protein n=1 Tax=Meridianimarinicoccus zhengii TaxID=2056810 RepID=UPI000DACBEA0|nr:aryldialkylphosphatase [Phycocomes zhengii]
MASDHAQTVLGPIRPEALGVTMMHEHVLCDVTPPALAASAQERVTVTLENVHNIRFHWTRHYGNHILDDEDLISRELGDYRAAGGGTVIDLTIRGIGPNPAGLARIARSSGANIVAGTGYYIAEFCATALAEASTDDMAAAMIRDLRIGFGDTGIRAGIIGEIGVSDPWHPDEKRAMTAAALAQQETGAAITVHPGRDPGSPQAVLSHLVAVGADPERVIIGHLDRTFTHPDQALALADTGCVLEWDFFGIESSYYPFSDLDMPNDAGRLAMIAALLKVGLGDRILISQDICTLTRLRRGGGHGYAHILTGVVPVMTRKGFCSDEIDRILVHTPRRMLTLSD